MDFLKIKPALISFDSSRSEQKVFTSIYLSFFPLSYLTITLGCFKIIYDDSNLKGRTRSIFNFNISWVSQGNK